MSGLSPQFILRAALSKELKRVTKEYGEKLAKGERVYRHDTPESHKLSGESEIENLTWYPDYAEPGYSLSHGEKGILAADWNYFPRDVDKLLERAGFEVEWSDEWTDCSECGKAIRTSPDSYDFQKYWVWQEDECVCLNCVDWPEYLKSIEDDASKAVVRECDPSKFGYVRVSQEREYENGWHPGQTDSPRVILDALHEKGEDRIIFRIPETSQFYIEFETWQRAPTLDNVMEYCKHATADNLITDDDWDSGIQILENLQRERKK